MLFSVFGRISSDGHAGDSGYDVKPIVLPHSTEAIVLDHLAYDRVAGRIWVPGSNTGNIYIIASDSDAVSVAPGFFTAEVELEGKKAKMGPTVASIGEGVVYVGNRGTSSLCAVDAQSYKCEGCVEVKRPSGVADAGPHGIAYVPATREVWLTTGPGKTIQIFDASEPRHPKWKTEIALESASEGYAVDNKRGRFYTNMADSGATVAIDLRSHRVIAKWDVGSHDLQGIALDVARGFVFVACADHVVSLDADHENKVLDSIVTGAGLDDIDFSEEQNQLYAAASATATLAVIQVSDAGTFQLHALVPTTYGARGVTLGKKGAAYVIDPAKGRVLKASTR